MNHNLILILDFGAQYSQLIARRVREAKIYCEILPYDASIERIKQKNPKGIIFSGGPASVYAGGAPTVSREIFDLGVPILGICYGGQLISQLFGGKVSKASSQEFGKTDLHISDQSGLFANLGSQISCWMSHNDYIEAAPEGFEITATTESCPVAAMKLDSKKLHCVQFHPEVEHTPQGREIIANFCLLVCKLQPDWDMGDFSEESIRKIRQIVGSGKALCALSGGVDSSVAAVLMQKAIGNQLVCVFVDHGLLRKNEGDEVEELFRKQFDINLIRVNAKERFLSKLAGVTEPEQKRKIIGEEFIRVFEEEKRKIGKIDFLVQGTIYPDVIESGSKTAAVIKSHHNVGGLPKDVDFQLIEPLNQLFKDEVRELGRKLGIPEQVVARQPFPGPGLAIRILGDITPEKLELLQEADFIYRDEIRKAGLEFKIWQYFAVLTNIRSVGVMGDDRTYSNTIALRAVTSTDGMTSDWAKIPYEVLEKISTRIVNNVPNINRIVYDITTKPPSTIEWE